MKEKERILFRVRCYDGFEIFVRARYEDEAKEVAGGMDICNGHTVSSALPADDADYYDEIDEYNRQMEAL